METSETSTGCEDRVRHYLVARSWRFGPVRARPPARTAPELGQNTTMNLTSPGTVEQGE